MNKIGARECTVVEVDKAQAIRFLQAFHEQGSCEGQKVCLGLMHKNYLVALMTFGTPRYNDNAQWELLRLCYRYQFTVVGGAKKLFNHFLNLVQPENVISYCNLDLFSGDVYTRLQFKKLGTPRESFRWCKDNEWISDAQLRKYGADNLLGTSDGKGTSNEAILLREGWQRKHYQTVQTYLWDSTISGIIYKITNKLNNKCYIGRSKYNDDSRWKAHCSLNQQLIDREIQEFGKENFLYEVIDTASSFYELNRKEREWIAKLKPEYNERPGGHYNLVDSRSEETKKKISMSMKQVRATKPEKYVVTKETKQKIRQANLGKKQSEETRAKRSQSMKGKKQKPVSDETREKMRNSAQHRAPISEETRRKLSESQRKGQHRPEDILKAQQAAAVSIKGKKVVYDLTGKKHLVAPEEVEFYLQQGYAQHKSRNTEL